MAVCNTTLSDGYIHETPLFANHDYDFHSIGLAICAVFGLISIVISFFLIISHANNYTRPWEQRHIIRILFMIPIYSTVSFLSYVFYRKSVYFEVLRDCYEAFAIASFFSLLCAYIAPTVHEQKDYFRTVVPRNWVLKAWGLQYCTGGENRGPFRKPRNGLTWFNICWIGIFQYCLIRVFFTLVAVITQATGRYCEASMSPAFAHVWVTAFEAISVTVAMFFLIQFYIQLKDVLAENKPFLKILSIKLVIFFSFWQTLVISALSSDTHGVIHASDKLSYQDIKIGIGSILLCIEMAIFSIIHIFAFPWTPYRAPSLKNHGGPLGIYAYWDSFNPWDMIKALARGLRWLFVGARRRHEDISYQQPPPKIHDDGLGYKSPTYTSTGEPATELLNQNGKSSADEDRTGLLQKGDSGSPPYPSAYTGVPQHDVSMKQETSYQAYRPQGAPPPAEQGPYVAYPAGPYEGLDQGAGRPPGYGSMGRGDEG